MVQPGGPGRSLACRLYMTGDACMAYISTFSHVMFWFFEVVLRYTSIINTSDRILRDSYV